MKKEIVCVCIFLLMLTGCFTRSALMTRTTFDDIAIGSSISEVTEVVGEPYAIYSNGPDIEEYEYIEKIDVGNRRVIAENHYYIIVSNGRIIGKREVQKSPPAYNLIYQDDPDKLNY